MKQSGESSDSKLNHYHQQPWQLRLALTRFTHSHRNNFGHKPQEANASIFNALKERREYCQPPGLLLALLNEQ
jgi:hypothetical protein